MPVFKGSLFQTAATTHNFEEIKKFQNPKDSQRDGFTGFGTDFWRGFERKLPKKWHHGSENITHSPQLRLEMIFLKKFKTQHHPSALGYLLKFFDFFKIRGRGSPLKETTLKNRHFLLQLFGCSYFWPGMEFWQTYKRWYYQFLCLCTKFQVNSTMGGRAMVV